MADDRGAPSYETDQRYFNRYREGYSPYMPADLDLILDDLLAAVDGTSVSKASRSFVLIARRRRHP